ncbi:MAG: hypothetical protein P4L82_09645 [Ancalomicrobiaceae bacterium]|nr:hypothetical protein [Ancalomicrobiaceae bacterium]
MLKALDWLAATEPLSALGMAFALQASWSQVASAEHHASIHRHLLIPNAALILQSVAFALIEVGAFEELRAMADDLIPDLRQLRMPFSAELFVVASAEAALRLGQACKLTGTWLCGAISSPSPPFQLRIVDIL